MSDKSLKLVNKCTLTLDKLCEHYVCDHVQVLLMLLTGYANLRPGEILHYTGPEGLEYTLSKKAVLS